MSNATLLTNCSYPVCVLVDWPMATASWLIVGFIFEFSSSPLATGVEIVGVPALFGVLYKELEYRMSK
jgi:hypothetical protein